MKAGFTLIELLVALFVSSLISAVIYNSFVMTNRMVSAAGVIVDVDVRLATLYNQLESDLTGAFAPHTEIVTTLTVESKDQATQKETAQKKTESSKIRSIFYSTNKDNNLHIISFITSNPLAIYSEAKNAVQKPRIVRVVYRIKSQEEAGTFSIERQESTDLDLKVFEPGADKKIRSYTVIDGIKSIQVEYHYPLKQTDEQKKKKEKLTFKKAVDWQPENWTEQEKKQLPPIPQFAFFTIVFANDQQYSMRFELPCFASAINPPQRKEAQKQLPKDDQATQKKKEADKASTSDRLKGLAEKIKLAFNKPA